MDNRKLLALTDALRGKPLHEVDAILRAQHLDATERLAVKVQLSAAAATGRHTVRAGFTLATDTAEYQRHQEQRPRSEIQRLLDRVAVDATRTYTEAELTELLHQAGIIEPEQRIALRLECRARGLTRDASEADRLLKNLGIDGPVDLLAIGRTMDERGYGPTAKAVVKSELQMRGWLKGGGNRSMRAAAARGTVLKDRRGNHLTLRSIPE